MDGVRGEVDGGRVRGGWWEGEGWMVGGRGVDSGRVRDGWCEGRSGWWESEGWMVGG